MMRMRATIADKDGDEYVDNNAEKMMSALVIG